MTMIPSISVFIGLEFFGFEQDVTHIAKNSQCDKEENHHGLNVFKELNGFVKKGETKQPGKHK